MKTRYALTVFGALAFIACESFSYPTDAKLAIGDKAPPIKVHSWVQGEPLKALKPGRIYIVEFWATWCGPCYRAMPHLSELSRKYSKELTVIGVNTWEDKLGAPTFLAPGKVKDFLKKNPNRMSYRVAIDTRNQDMAASWLKAAGANSIPTSFVVDKQGKIAFIGHPLDLEVVIPALISGRFDAVAFAKRPKTPDLTSIDEALVARNLAKVRDEAELLGKEYPSSKDITDGYLLAASFAEDPDACGKLAQDYVKNEKFLSIGVAITCLMKCPWLSSSHAAQLAGVAELALNAPEADTFLIVLALPDLYIKAGKKDKAIAAIENLMQLSKKFGATEEYLKRLEERKKEVNNMP